jgi:formate dehydrogenase alpha subunit
MTKEKTLSVTIDNKKVEAKPDQTILQAARANGYYIPSLCAFEHLPSYGACRLCVVEVDGLRGFPTSCTTPVEEGMVIRTDTAELRSLRQEILKLLLSEHPASCLFCDQHDECKEFQGTIRKAGVTTGCRYCPNDNRCELQVIVDKVGLTETSYPVYYRNFPVEKHDPFYDRDYNLCILCGRCVRVCGEVRLNGTLSFKQRGKQTTIGPAFDRSHLDAGCEFCGACVTVCPTGALSAKVSKWDGKPDAQVGTACSYCPVGCRLIFQVKKNQVLDALPDYDSPFDQGLICVKGRFGITEYIHNPGRIGTPKRLTGVGYEEITWDEAIRIAAEKLSGVKGKDFLMVVSPQLATEDLFVAQQFTRQVMGSEEIASRLPDELGDDLPTFLDLVVKSEPYDGIDRAKTIIAVGFDSLYGFSPIGIALKKASQKGATLVAVNADESSINMLSEAVFVCEPSQWPELLSRFTEQKRVGKTVKGRKETDLFSQWAEDIERIGKAVKAPGENLIVLGTNLLASPVRGEILERVQKLRDAGLFKVIIVHPYTNLSGFLAMGLLPGMKPGELLRQDGDGNPYLAKGDLGGSASTNKKKVIYVVGEGIREDLPECEFLIYQNGLPAGSSRQPDLILPASLFAESPGTLISLDGRVLNIAKAVEPHMDAKPDWWIMTRIAEKMGKGGKKYKDVSAVQAEIKKFLKGFPVLKKRVEFRGFKAGGGGSARGRYRAGLFPRRSSYRGILLSGVVAGIKVLEDKA